MRYKYFLMEERMRGVQITRERAVELLHTKCKKTVKHWFDRGECLWRGVPRPTEFYWIDPSKTKRQSRNTDNIYTVLLDNDPRWSKFPKRSEAIICSTERKKADGYGTVCRVFAYDGANYGVCPERDIWYSFKRTFNDDWLPLGIANQHLREILGRFGIYLDTDFNYHELEIAIKDASFNLDADEETMEYLMGSGNGNKLVKLWQQSNVKTFYDWFMGIWDPNKNKFVATKDIKTVFNKAFYNGSEVWTDSKSVLVGAYNYNREEMRDMLSQ